MTDNLKTVHSHIHTSERCMGGGGIITADGCFAMQNFRSKNNSCQERVSQLNKHVRVAIHLFVLFQHTIHCYAFI